MATNPYGHGQMVIADVRGWGHLIGVGACNLSSADAAEIQDANGRLLAGAREMYDLLGPLVSCANVPVAIRDGIRALLARIDGKEPG